jgi:NAD(P)-dependent dehydrogenase (short-subunit alcohol dehydrogenase family)
MSELTGRVAVVTAAASPIGRATATALCTAGARLVLADPDADAVAPVAADLTDAVTVTAALAAEADIARIIQQAVESLGAVDILVNIPTPPDAALRAADRAIVDLDPDLFDDLLEGQLTSFAMATKHVVGPMRERGGGVIINLAHVAGVQAHLSEPMLGSAQAGVIGLTRNIAAQYGRSGIRAVCVSVGGIEAGSSGDEHERALRRHSVLPWDGVPADVANVIRFLASDGARFVTGINVPVDGGLTTHFPNWAEMVLS